MAHDLGVKYACYQCGTKFYDLHKPAPICPKCKADQRASPVRSQAAAERRKARSRDATEVVGDEEGPAVADDDDLEVGSVPGDADDAPIDDEPEEDLKN